VQSYSAPLATLGLTDSAITVLASGFLDSTVNSNGKSFGLWVTKASGGGLIPLPTASVTNVSTELTSIEAMLYPNPATETLTLSGFDSNIKTIEIMDISGKIMTGVQMLSTETIDISLLPQGMYLLKVQDKSGSLNVYRFMKQ
jgi:hypothetical protein